MLSKLTLTRIPKFAMPGQFAAPKFGKNISPVMAGWMTRLLGISFAWGLGSLVWFWISPYSSGQTKVSTAPTSSTSYAKSPHFQTTEITKNNLFGVFDENVSTAVAQTSLVNAPVTNLSLTLVGVVYATTPTKGLAIITSGGVQNIYGVGETIDGTGVILKQVLKDRVIFNNRNKNETLMLDGVDYDKPEATQKPASVANTGKFSAVSADGLSKIKKEILNNPQSLLKYITLSRESEQGQVVGYRLGPGSDGQLFKEAGIKNGDVAVAVNGVDLTEPSNMSQIWKNLADTSEITMTVKRKGQLHKIYISL